MKKNNQAGVAMIMALSAITILAILAAELVYETQVYHRIVYNSVDQTRSHYLAKSGLALAKLQIIGAEKAVSAIKSLGITGTVNQSDIDLIWQTPIILPPPMPPGADLLLKDKVNKLNKDLGLQGSITISIKGESTKLNLNQLVWQPTKKSSTGAKPPQSGNTGTSGSSPNTPTLTPEEYKKNIRKTYVSVLENLMKQKKEVDNNFSIKYESLTAENLIGNILAWMDPKTELDGENAPKEQYYRQLASPYAIKNAPLFSISEINLIKNIDDELQEFIGKYFTALVTEGININQVPLETIKGIFPSISEENLKKIKDRRELTPFEKLDDFWKFMQNDLGYNEDAKKEFDATGIVITTKETAYRVQITSTSGSAQKNWLAYIGLTPPPAPIENTPQNTSPGAAPIDPNAPDNNNNNQNKTSTQTNDNSTPTIIYLKTD